MPDSMQKEHVMPLAANQYTMTKLSTLGNEAVSFYKLRMLKRHMLNLIVEEYIIKMSNRRIDFNGMSTRLGLIYENRWRREKLSMYIPIYPFV